MRRPVGSVDVGQGGNSPDWTVVLEESENLCMHYSKTFY